MAADLRAVAFDVAEAAAVGAFWAELLQRPLVMERGDAFVAGDDGQVGLSFVASDSEQIGPRRIHLHLASATREDQEHTVARALRLGGHLRTGQDPDHRFVVLADPGGNELCVIEPGNAFLAATGYLGEVTCDGSRDVGLFWRDALAWSLVWDRDGETSIQSPLGGTKVSWGGPPVEPKRGRNRQRFDLVADDPTTEVERLLSLGATLVRVLEDGLELADPDGNEFILRAS